MKIIDKLNEDRIHISFEVFPPKTDAGFEKVMDEFNVDFVLGGHDHVYSRSYVLKDGQRNSERLDTINDPDGTIYLTGNCCSDMQYYTPFEKLDKNNNADFPILVKWREWFCILSGRKSSCGKSRVESGV